MEKHACLNMGFRKNVILSRLISVNNEYFQITLMHVLSVSNYKLHAIPTR